MIDDYIATFPDDIQSILHMIRQTIKQAAPPEAHETISYKMPAFQLHNKPLIYFAAFKTHIGIYPPISADPGDKDNAMLIQELSVYAGPKRNLKFPLSQPIPYDLVTEVVKCRVKEVNCRVLAVSEKATKAERRKGRQIRKEPVIAKCTAKVAKYRRGQNEIKTTTKRTPRNVKTPP